jgi:hypothetical protein
VASAAWCSLRAAWKRMCSMRKFGRSCPFSRCQCRAAEELPATPERRNGLRLWPGNAAGRRRHGGS